MVKQQATRRPRAGQTRQRVLEAATRLFAERGFAAISMRDIADECGANLPSIYHYFGDKGRLYDACYRATFEQAAEVLHVAISRAATPRQRIEDFTVQLCGILMDNHDFRRLLQREFLREERRRITSLTTHHFQREFRLLTQSIAELYGEPQAMERCFAIYGLALGLLQMRRIGELAGMDREIARTPQSLARYVLSIVLPPLSPSGAIRRQAPGRAPDRARGRAPAQRAATQRAPAQRAATRRS